MQASFLQHEGYLGALGALMSYGDPRDENLNLEESQEVSSYDDILYMFNIFLHTTRNTTNLSIVFYLSKMLVHNVHQ